MLIDQELDDKPQHNVNLSMQSLLMDSHPARSTRWRTSGSASPTGGMYVQKKRASDGKLEPDEDRVLGLLDGQRTVLELGQAAKLTEFDVTRSSTGCSRAASRRSRRSRCAPAPEPAPVAAGGRRRGSPARLREAPTQPRARWSASSTSSSARSATRWRASRAWPRVHRRGNAALQASTLSHVAGAGRARLRRRRQPAGDKLARAVRATKRAARLRAARLAASRRSPT